MTNEIQPSEMANAIVVHATERDGTLARRVSQLEAENERLQFEATDWQERNERLSVEAGRLSVEVDGLRAALEQIATGPMDVWGAREVATAALADHKE